MKTNKLFLIAPMLVLLWPFGSGIKVSCDTPRICTLTLKADVAADTNVYVRTAKGRNIPVPLRRGTHDAQFHLEADDAYVAGSASLKNPAAAKPVK